ncbi:MAG: hypothetical protein M5R36_06610 [Deltaproteobacteria bacterium]|nr:hypothetical protein [Deltaproteobacteria bacterium]
MLRAFYPLVLVLLAAAFLTGSACDRGDVENGEPDDYSDFENPGGEGPEVLFEPDADPIALLPQPNNILAREDKTTATGLRVNVPVEGPTDFLRYQREQLRKLDGFGNFNNIAVSFSEPVDLATITHDDIFLINVQRDSEHFGEFIEVDLDRGYYPKDLLRKESFFPNDELADAKDVLYAPGNRVDWYEDETNTLLIRPLYPLRQRTKYVVALTTDLRGEDGEPVRPPD